MQWGWSSGAVVLWCSNPARGALMRPVRPWGGFETAQCVHMPPFFYKRGSWAKVHWLVGNSGSCKLSCSRALLWCCGVCFLSGLPKRTMLDHGEATGQAGGFWGGHAPPFFYKRGSYKKLTGTAKSTARRRAVLNNYWELGPPPEGYARSKSKLFFDVFIIYS